MAVAATTASSPAATVQITLIGNNISNLGGNHLAADLTGGGVDDMTFASSGNRPKGIFYVILGVYGAAVAE